MMAHRTSGWRAAVGGFVAVTALSACSRSRTSAGRVDTAALQTSSYTQAESPAAQVTSTDAKSVTRAGRYELTDDNFSKFVAASDSLVALEGRDPTARAYLSNDLKGAGAKTQDAGLKWLEANPTVNNAIAGAGISVEDYFVAAIAIASAERYVADPKAAPPTPTLTKNAEFLGAHQAQLTHLEGLRQNAPGVVVTP
jgi:hypothetical protein